MKSFLEPDDAIDGGAPDDEATALGNEGEQPEDGSGPSEARRDRDRLPSTPPPPPD